MEYHIDATNKTLGRLATEIAVRLRRKDTAEFNPTRTPFVRIVVSHTDRLRFTGKKGKQKLYRRHSGYPGGLKTETLDERMAKDSTKVLYHAVMGMLPKNRTRSRLLRNLILHREDEKK